MHVLTAFIFLINDLIKLLFNIDYKVIDLRELVFKINKVFFVRLFSIVEIFHIEASLFLMVNIYLIILTSNSDM